MKFPNIETINFKMNQTIKDSQQQQLKCYKNFKNKTIQLSLIKVRVRKF